MFCFSNKNHLLSSNKGFNLVEILVSVAVFLIGLVTLIVIFGRIIQPFPYITTRFEASYLAKEGIELVRNRRDQNWIREEDWDSGLNNVGDLSTSIFNREVNVSISDDKYADIVSTVSWTLRGESHSVEVRSRIYNWY